MFWVYSQQLKGLFVSEECMETVCIQGLCDFFFVQYSIDDFPSRFFVCTWHDGLPDFTNIYCSLDEVPAFTFVILAMPYENTA